MVLEMKLNDAPLIDTILGRQGVFKKLKKDGTLLYIIPGFPPRTVEYPVKLDQENIIEVSVPVLDDRGYQTRKVAILVPHKTMNWRGIDKKQMPYYHIASDHIKDEIIEELRNKVTELNDALASKREELDALQAKKRESQQGERKRAECPICYDPISQLTGKCTKPSCSNYGGY